MQTAAELPQALDQPLPAEHEAGAVDYLLEPVAAGRLAQAVARLRERLQSRAPAPALDDLSVQR